MVFLPVYQKRTIGISRGGVGGENPLTLRPKTNKKDKKYLGINLTKHTQDLYTKNYKTLMKESQTSIGGAAYHVQG